MNPLLGPINRKTQGATPFQLNLKTFRSNKIQHLIMKVKKIMRLQLYNSTSQLIGCQHEGYLIELIRRQKIGCWISIKQAKSSQNQLGGHNQFHTPST